MSFHFQIPEIVHEEQDMSSPTDPFSWICEVHDAAGAVESFIRKVPPKHRTNGEHYEPVSWRFGLNNCPETILRSNGTEGFKIKVARALQLTGELWNIFCLAIVTEPKEYWKAVYGWSSHASFYTIERIRCLLSLDALFLVVFLHTYALGIVNTPLRLNQELGTVLKNQALDDVQKKKALEELMDNWTLEKMIGNRALKEVMKDPVLETYKDTLWHDIWLVENQIPKELLKRVVGFLVTHKLMVMPAWEDHGWQGLNTTHCVPWNFFFGSGIDAVKVEELFKARMTETLKYPDSYYGIHILDSVYRILCGHKSLNTPHDHFYQNVPSATHLEACGVKIQGTEFASFEGISFENGCLKMPFLRIKHETQKLFRNLIVHEVLSVHKDKRQYSVNCDGVLSLLKGKRLQDSINYREVLSLLEERRHYSVSCYTNFMESLMKTPADVDLLVNQGVLSVHVGSHAMVVDMWKCINCNISAPRVSVNFHKMLKDLNNHSKNKKKQLGFEFKRDYCKPWMVLSVLTVTLVTIATGIQTYTSVIGSDGMKPHFSSQP